MQKGSRNVFYHLITRVTDHHFWRLLLIAQTNSDTCERGHTGHEYQEAGIIGAILEACTDELHTLQY